MVVECLHADYKAKSGDSSVLQKPLRSELSASEVRNVFGFPRNMKEKYSLGKVLGAGSFGVVRRCTECSTGKKYAVKSIPKMPKNHKCTPRYLLKLQTEVDSMGQLGSSLDAVYLKDVFEDDAAIHLVMELCEGGSVLDRLKDGEYSERQVAHIMRSVLRFLSQCHSKGIVYRDVKPENFMLLHSAPILSSTKKGKKSNKKGKGYPLWKSFSSAIGIRQQSITSSDDEAPVSPGEQVLTHELLVKATDFGLSIKHRSDEPPLKSRSGTPAYMAPEVIQQSYTEKADIWSAGIMMYQLLTGKFPFWENVRDCTLQEVWKAILTQQIDFEATELSQISDSARDLLRRMLHRNPGKRVSAQEALSHRWLTTDDAAPALPLRSSVVQRLQRFATYGMLKQVVLRIIADDIHEDSLSSLNNEQPLIDAGASESAVMLLQTLSILFDELDVDASGSVSMDELVSGLDRLGYDVEGEELEQLMTKVDTNKDGSLQLPEFVAGMMDWPTLQKDDRWGFWVDRAFDKLDRNGDGYLALDSLEELISDIGGYGDGEEPERITEARRMLREADQNGDGKVSREEFADLLTAGPTPDVLSHYDPRVRGPAADMSTVDGELESEDDWRMV
jgi:calcium-dependent protein kinase